MHNRNWKLIYGSYAGMEKKAIELINREMGALLLRDPGRYTIHVLPLEQAAEAEIDRNAVVVGLYDEIPLLSRLVSPEEIPEGDYLVKAVDNPVLPGYKLVLVTAWEGRNLFYGAVDLVDDYFALAAPEHGPVKLYDEALDGPMPDYYSASAPAIQTRSVFTWGHPINDYRDYIENMARLRLNQLIIWNDFPPINAADVVAYAHEYGIQVIWGFAWGWSRDCASADMDSLEALAADIIALYQSKYSRVPGDGIYFQSFTELAADRIGDRLVADAVVELVNTVSRRLLAEKPGLLIQFGLHATSVKDHLEFIAQVDSRVEIMWEDCGIFPYGYDPFARDEAEFRKAVEFTDKILDLRQLGRVSMLYKGFMTLDWVGDRFVHQAGPFLLGGNPGRLAEHDRALLTPAWRHLQSGWLQNGEVVHTLTRHILASGRRVTLGMAGQFAGGIWFPEALCAQILWDAAEPYESILRKVTNRRSVTMA